MSNQDELNSVAPGIPQGTNAGLLSSTGVPQHTDTGMSTGSSDGLMSRVSAVVDSGKSRLAGGLHGLGDRIEHTGRDLQSGNMFVRPVGRALNSTGEALEDGARYLRRNDVGVIGDDVVDGIRHNPLIAAGVAIGCGWLLGRVFSSDEGDRREREFHELHEARERDMDEEVEEETEHESGRSAMMDGIRDRVTGLVAAGVVSLAARQIRNRIAGR